MPRFFVDRQAICQDKIVLCGAEAHHISYSLRMAVGDEITVLDGCGNAYFCRLAQMDGETVIADILSVEKAKGESPLAIHLFQAYPKSDKLEWIIQKSVELGVHTITPFESERCIKRPKSDKMAQKNEREQKIATEAAKQCGRGILPAVTLPISFRQMLEEAKKYPLALFCYEGEGTLPIRDILEKHPALTRVALIVGCEGGFSENEVALAKEAGLTLTGLGPRILRCETAPLYALTALSYAYELS